MPAMLIAVGVWVISSVIAKLFVALGIGIFTYYGIYELIQQLLAQVQGLMGTLPAAVFQLLSLAGIPQALSIIGSAILTRASINAIQLFFGVRS
jgi:hypothetical protein